MKSISKPMKKIMPSRNAAAKAPISKGTVKAAQPKGFPAQTANAYKKPSRVVVSRRGAAGSKG